MNPNFRYQQRPPLLPIPAYYPIKNNYGNNASATASPDSGIYCPRENLNIHPEMCDLYPLPPSLPVSPYWSQSAMSLSAESYHPYYQYSHQYTHHQKQVPNSNSSVYRNPAINCQPPIPGKNAILGGNSLRSRNETISPVPQIGSMSDTSTTLRERPPYSISSISCNNEGNTRPVKVFLGRVTSLEGDLGVIDKETFFHISAVVKRTELPKIGDNVLVKAEVVTRMPGFKWNAKEVQLVKIGMNQEDHRKNLPPVPPAPKICMTRTPSVSGKSKSTKSRYKSDRDYSYDRRSGRSSSRQRCKYRSRSKSREKYRRERNSEWEYRNTVRVRYTRKYDASSQLIVRNKNKESYQSDYDTVASELTWNEKTEIFVKTNEELNICRDIHAIMNETLTTSPDSYETQLGTESEISKDNGRSGSVEYAKGESENSEVGVNNFDKCASPDQTPNQIPGVLDRVENATQNPTNIERNLPADSSPNTPVTHALQDIQIKTEKVDSILSNILLTVGKNSTLSPTADLPADNTRIKQEPPEETPESPNLNKYSTILSTSLPNNHPIILPVEIDKVKEEPPERPSTESDEHLLANHSFLADKTPISTGPSASTAVVNPTRRRKHIKTVNSIPKGLYFGIPEVISKIQDEKHETDQRDEAPAKIPTSTSNDCFNNLVTSDRLTSRLVSLSDENVSVRLKNWNADLSVESISNDDEEVNEERNTNSEGTGLVNYEISNYNADISNPDDQEHPVHISYGKETLTKKSEFRDHSLSETEIPEPRNQNCSTSAPRGAPVQSISPAQVLMNMVGKVRSGVSGNPENHREEEITRKEPNDNKRIVNQSTTSDNLNSVVPIDHVAPRFAPPLSIDKTISDCLHVASAELPEENSLRIVNVPNPNNPDSCINATGIIETSDKISNIRDLEKTETGQILNPSIGNSEQNLKCHESVAINNPNASNSQVSQLAKNLIEVQLKEYSEIMRTMSVKRASEPRTCEGGKKRRTLLRRPRVFGNDPYDEYANQSAEFFRGTAGHGPPNVGNGRRFDSNEEPIAGESRRFSPRVDFSFNGIDPTFNDPREPGIPTQQLIAPLMNDAPIRPGIGICQVCGKMGHHESVCRRQSNEIELHRQEPSIMRLGDAHICQICGKSGHGAHCPRNAKFNSGVEPALVSCLFCGIKGHDVSVCRKQIKADKCKICKEIGHHENMCRRRPKDFGVLEPQGEGLPPDCSKRVMDEKCKICKKTGHHENLCGRHPKNVEMWNSISNPLRLFAYFYCISGQDVTMK